MKKAILSLIGIAVVLYILFVVLKPAAIAPNGELRSPTPILTATPTPTPTANITVRVPTPGQLVAKSITVIGTARVFEQQFNWRLVDTKGTTLAEGSAMSSAPDAGIFGPYSFVITVPANAPKDLVIWVFDYSAKDGAIQDLVTVPVHTQ